MIATTTTYSLRAFSPGAPPGTFSFDFTFQQTSEINAVLYGPGLPGVTLTQGVDYTVSPTPPAIGGTINVIGSNWAGAYAAYGNIRIYRKTAIVNNTALVNGGAIDANVLEFVIDELTQVLQEQGPGGIASFFDLTAPPTDPPGLNYVLPAASVRANTGLLFDAQGNVIAGSPSAVTINAIFQAALLSGSTALLLALLNLTGETVLSTGSPYSAPSTTLPYLIIAAPYTFLLPAATGSGNEITVLNGNAGAGLITITPNGTDKTGPAGNVSIFLQNVDQSGQTAFQWVKLKDAKAGTWAVVGGVYAPHQTVDTDGSQYNFGGYHRLPTGNTTSREITGAALVPTAQGTWYGSAIQGSGALGVPAGAKGIKVKLNVTAQSTSGGVTALAVAFSDNNSSNPTGVSSHPWAQASAKPPLSNDLVYSPGIEIDIPLNSLGQFYMFSLQVSNVNVANSTVILIVMGWWDGL